jgi:hypothetical protein
MKCPVCKRAKCQWVGLKSNPTKVKTEELKKIIDHNLSYIDMVFTNNQGSANAEERMINSLAPYAEELEKRKVKK